MRSIRASSVPACDMPCTRQMSASEVFASCSRCARVNMEEAIDLEAGRECDWYKGALECSGGGMQTIAVRVSV